MMSRRAHSRLHTACHHELEPFIRGPTAISNSTTLSLSWEGGGWRLAHDRSPTSQVERQGYSGYFSPSAMDLVIRLALQLTPCSTTCTTEDFVNVLESLSENYAQDRTDAYRNYLNRNLRSHGAHVVLCTLVFLLVVEWMHFRHKAHARCLPGRTTHRPGERPPARAGAEPMTLRIDNPFEDYRSPPIQAIVVDIEVSAYEDMHACPGLSDSIPDEGGGKSVLYVLSCSP
ncbi:hypothetical protein F5141DRAFT_472307 [Pisolithus sp. B1]|nr:hypothetical protein F5141DRAFT_472307 [Pisolithus sp. B1]